MPLTACSSLVGILGESFPARTKECKFFRFPIESSTAMDCVLSISMAICFEVQKFGIKALNLKEFLENQFEYRQIGLNRCNSNETNCQALVAVNFQQKRLVTFVQKLLAKRNR